MSIVRQPVNSTYLKEVGYDEATKTLQVLVRGKRETVDSLIEHYEVPKSEFEALMKASSMGNYFNVHIAKAYSYKKLE